MIRDKNFYKAFFSMMIVLVLQNVITFSVNLEDNLMLGAYSETALSGVAAVNQVQFIYQNILLALGEAMVIIGTQYFGGKQLEPVKTVAAFAMRNAVYFSIGLFVLVSIFPYPIMAAFTTDSAIAAEGVSYMMVIRYTYLIFAIAQMLLCVLRSIGIVKIALWLSAASLVLNFVGNYALIYGHFGCPALGVEGAAISTILCRAVELLILILFITLREKQLHLKLKDFFRRDKVLHKDYRKVMLPLLLVQGLWGFSNAIQNMILGHMTSSAIAANSVASTMFMLVKSMAIGTASASGFFIGRTIGEGDAGKLRSVSKTLQVLFIGVGLVSGIILFLIRIPILSLYSLEPETKAMADQFLIVLSIIIVTMSYQMPTNSGIIKSGGDTKYAMWLDLISIWVIVIPLSLIMAFVVKASPLVVLCCLNADQVFKCIPAFIKANYGHWAKKLTRS